MKGPAKKKHNKKQISEEPNIAITVLSRSLQPKDQEAIAFVVLPETLKISFVGGKHEL